MAWGFVLLAEISHHRRLQMKMKHLLGGVAVIAALALSAPAWAQPANPAATGRGFGPKASGGNYVPPSAPTPATTEPSSSSATPPKHRHARTHHVVGTHQMLHAHGPKSGTDTTAQLNQAELARLQQGAPPMPPQMAPPPPMPGGNSMGMPGPNAGGPGLTPYSTGTPHESEHGTVQR
jgi:hypothetical protein